ncbi:ABC-type oligopeptide transport system, ATPase component [Hahella chejuensis KCTC 2396]|uniref:ABC-type oligopeptide transport system, ATPase component n=1 Tax=Hahella chejuensis (strain KCTC 2396) TaxID=349521 RepID=Q2SMW5_HAHCH|nr:oligopeptide/dipeptide ABC transporter ATP-binding protein [Hahella chejuensis]ABC28009.1 ABC-type oligopeptide transport system, ATPase component [Hahella chejuensis KCTC 2396]
MSSASPILSVQDLCVRFDLPRSGVWPWRGEALQLKAVNNISFDLYPGEILGIVGESGCGKSTLARAILGMLQNVQGKVVWQGEDMLGLSPSQLRKRRQKLQMVFQDPIASLSPRMTVGEIIAEPLKTHYPAMSSAEREAKVVSIMETVGLHANQVNRYPHEFSGGQCQRVGIARALVLEPDLIICDEPVSALDVSIQAQIVNLLKKLQRELGLSLIFIAHDLNLVKYISDRVMVLYLGHVMEVANSRDLYREPLHPYSKALISAVPIPDPELERGKEVLLLEGDLPSPINPPAGCPFVTRCPMATQVCEQTKPELRAVADGQRRVACHHA